MPEIRDYAVAAGHDGRLEILATVATDDIPGSSLPARAVWRAREVPAPDGGPDQWAPRWQSLGNPGDATELDGMMLARDTDGRLEAVTVAWAPDGGTVLHAWQDAPDGNWVGWESLGFPEPGVGSPATLTRDEAGRLELFAAHYQHAGSKVWHRRQVQPGGSQWTEWLPLGWPPVTSSLFSLGVPMAAGLNQDGRMELHIIHAEKLWHTWQKAPGSLDWVAWQSLDSPPGALEGMPALALSGDGRLRVFTPGGPGGGDPPDYSAYCREQKAPGRAWDEWFALDPRPTDATGLAVAPGADGRLVVCSVGGKEGAQSLARVEQGPLGPGDPGWAGDDGLGFPGYDGAGLLENPVLVLDGHGRLRLFFTIATGSQRGSTELYSLNQVSPNGDQWEGQLISLQAP